MPKPGSKKNTESSTDKLRAGIEDQKKKNESRPIKYSATFKNHIFEGESANGTHKGLHSLCRLNARADAKPNVVKTKKAPAAQCYTAAVTLHGNSSPKSSSFFPDNWDEKTILSAIEQAIKYCRNHPGVSTGLCSGTGVHWAGIANVNGNDIVIGGLGGKPPNLDGEITSAFPQVEGTFLID